MQTGTVQEIGKTQKGSTKIKIDGQWYFPGRNVKGSLPSVGQSIEFDWKTFGDQGNLRSLESYTIKQASRGNGHAAAVSDDAEMRFISNCVGQAIAAKTIVDPNEIAVWFRAAKRALAGADDEFNDEPGF